MASGDNVSAIDTATNNVIANAYVGDWGALYGVAVSPDGKLVYVTMPSHDMVFIIDTTTYSVKAKLFAGIEPVGVAFNPMGKKAYVTSLDAPGTVHVIDTVTNNVIGLKLYPGIDYIGFLGIAVSPDGSKLYAASSRNVSVIDTATNTLKATVNVGSFAKGIAFSPDGKRVYVANQYSNDVSVINTKTNTVVATVNVGNEPLGVAVSPDGTKVYVANYNSNTVSVIDTATNTVTVTVPVGSAPIAFGQFIGSIPVKK